jgi:hypothetical protein
MVTKGPVERKTGQWNSHSIVRVVHDLYLFK